MVTLAKPVSPAVTVPLASRSAKTRSPIAPVAGTQVAASATPPSAVVPSVVMGIAAPIAAPVTGLICWTTVPTT
ncbi:hypothetical protein OPKNFCMD_3557 [Methylobacterium crusticola]|uniref:Uncharacterized protein n=1 Tax=Methylobacterium crusticola TaxID=1697972 RepID=A0ABQ4R1T2_9HYPH|nr:hypothetical protein OPKNFCMD_3557 [Methylobacterium crusticola]